MIDFLLGLLTILLITATFLVVFISPFLVAGALVSLYFMWLDRND